MLYKFFSYTQYLLSGTKFEHGPTALYFLFFYFNFFFLTNLFWVRAAVVSHSQPYLKWLWCNAIKHLNGSKSWRFLAIPEGQNLCTISKIHTKTQIYHYFIYTSSVNRDFFIFLFHCLPLNPVTKNMVLSSACLSNGWNTSVLKLSVWVPL